LSSAALSSAALSRAALSRIAITEPSLTLSPTLTFSSLTTPSADDGTSIVALSDSSVTRPWSLRTVSPTETSSSITGMPSKSPMSGTLTSMLAMRVSCASAGGAGERLFQLVQQLGELAPALDALFVAVVGRVDHQRDLLHHLDDGSAGG